MVHCGAQAAAAVARRAAAAPPARRRAALRAPLLGRRAASRECTHAHTHEHTHASCLSGLYRTLLQYMSLCEKSYSGLSCHSSLFQRWMLLVHYL